jgi:predicted  nucleic acid-binding Zn-ribbon protein
MEMFESDDYIIQLGEDGRYMVESMSTWKPGNPDL